MRKCYRTSVNFIGNMPIADPKKYHCAKFVDNGARGVKLVVVVVVGGVTGEYNGHGLVLISKIFAYCFEQFMLISVQLYSKNNLAEWLKVLL